MEKAHETLEFFAWNNDLQQEVLPMLEELFLNRRTMFRKLKRVEMRGAYKSDDKVVELFEKRGIELWL